MFVIKKYTSGNSQKSRIEQALFTFLYPNRTTVGSIQTIPDQENPKEEKLTQIKQKRQTLKPKPP